MADSLEELVNLGFETVREPSGKALERTIIVLGVARSGTSMIAAALTSLGIPMGAGKESIVYEDIELARAMELKDLELLKSIIRARNSKHAVWGFKRPSASAQMARIARLFRNPRFVVVFRDIFAIAVRNRISVSANLYNDMQSSLTQYGKILSFIQTSQFPTMLVSYEKALARREPFVRALSEFVGIYEERLINDAISSVEPEPLRYLQNARLTNVTGVLDPLTKNKIGGWAKPSNGDHFITVELYINGSKTMELSANLFRLDLKEKGMHATGNCGFLFDLTGKSDLKDGDIVSVRPKGEMRELNSSPRIFCTNSDDGKEHSL